MWGLRGSLFSSIHLYHPGDVERIDTSKRIGSNQHNPAVCINLFLRISQSDGLKDYDRLSDVSGREMCIGIPAGSFRCDKFVKSSLASSMAGFISGGREALLSSCKAATVVSMVFVCVKDYE